jgi:periplasmic protein TonB
MRVHSPRRVSQSPLAVAIGISVGFHLLVVAVALLVRTPANTPAMKRGEPLFVELPQADQPAERGAPAGPSSQPKGPTTPPAPPAVKAQPQPRAAPTPPQPSPREVRPPQPRAPEQTAAASPPPRPATPEAPAPDGLQAPAPAPKPPEPTVNEPEPAPEPPAREASPPPRVAAVPPQPPLVDSRSALRRGGPGGAGGSGEGWAGIEGEPIPLDSSDPKFNDYLERIRRMIKEKWGYPCVKDLASGHCDYKSARLVIVFGILKDGRVPVVEVAKQSGYPIYDDYAANAIKLAQPFPPVPASLMSSAKSGSAGVKIVAAFHYQLVESSLTNILR